jgi:hypothetical protein
MLERRGVAGDARSQERLQNSAQVLAGQLRDAKVGRVGPFARNDFAHGVADVCEDLAEFGVVCAHDVEIAQTLQQALPHARPHLVGAQDDIQQRPTLHRQRPAAGTQRAQMQEPELALVAGAALGERHVLVGARDREPGFSGELVGVGVIGALKPDPDRGLCVWRCGRDQVSRHVLGGWTPEFEVIAEFGAELIVEVGNDHFHDDPLARLALARLVVAAEEIVLVDRLGPRQAVRPDG